MRVRKFVRLREEVNDTASAISDRIIKAMQAKEPAERLKMGCSMFDFSRQLVMSSILHQFPNISKTEMRRELFLRFYGSDFSSIEQKKIIKHLQSR